MDGEISIQTAHLGLLGASLRDAATAIADEITDLDSAAATMVAGWEGEAAGAFTARYRTMRQDLAAERLQLLSCATLAEGIGTLYETADVELARLFGGDD